MDAHVEVACAGACEVYSTASEMRTFLAVLLGISLFALMTLLVREQALSAKSSGITIDWSPYMDRTGKTPEERIKELEQFRFVNQDAKCKDLEDMWRLRSCGPDQGMRERMKERTQRSLHISNTRREFDTLSWSIQEGEP